MPPPPRLLGSTGAFSGHLRAGRKGEVSNCTPLPVGNDRAFGSPERRGTSKVSRSKREYSLCQVRKQPGEGQETKHQHRGMKAGIAMAHYSRGRRPWRRPSSAREGCGRPLAAGKGNGLHFCLLPLPRRFWRPLPSITAKQNKRPLLGVDGQASHPLGKSCVAMTATPRGY